MNQSFEALTQWLQNAIQNDDHHGAIEAAKLLRKLGLAFKVAAQPPIFHYQEDATGKPFGIATETHALKFANYTVCEWRRQSIGRYGVNVNNPLTWAAISSDPPIGEYALLIRPVLRELGLLDTAPAVPEPASASATPRGRV